MEHKHYILAEKYRPKTLDEFIGDEQLKNSIQEQISSNNIQHLLLYGPSGVGKTTLAKIIVNTLDCDHLYLNSSQERGIETIREKVLGFSSSASFKPLKVVILDESDFMTIQSQMSLRNVIESYALNTRFILTCNFVERIIDPLQSRCQVIKITPPNKKDIAKHLSNILDLEQIKFELKDLAYIVNTYYPDLRKMLNNIQLLSKDKILNIDSSILISPNYIKDTIKLLSQPKPNWRNIRQIIANSGINDFEELYRTLYDKLGEYLPGKEGMATVFINEHLYKANFRIDKEICVMSLIQQLIELKSNNLIKG